MERYEELLKRIEELERTSDDLGIIVLDTAEELGQRINSHLQQIRGTNENYIIPINLVRFANGEAKVEILQTVRGKQLFVIADVGNNTITYNMNGQKNRKSPDDAFLDLLRVVDAVNGNAKEVNVVLPLFPYSRQHRRDCRVSMDCALAFQILKNLGVKKFITYDIHSPEVSSVVHDLEFDNIFPTIIFLKKILINEGINYTNKENVLVVAPDTGAAKRASFYSSMLECNMGIFNKRRDRKKMEDGRNPIVAHDYIGEDVAGKTVIVVDDMIASGNSILDVARDMKSRGAAKVILVATFPLFNNGIENFNKAYEEGIFDKVYATNAVHIEDEILDADWFVAVDCSELLAHVISNINRNEAISPLMNGKEEIFEILRQFKPKSKRLED